VYTVAKVLQYEPGGDGGDLCLNFKIGNKEYEGRVNEFSNGRTGKFFYVKINLDNPTKYILLTDVEVSQCMQKVLIPPDGWQEMPKDTCSK
jgi:hypothetical protein